jgi:hypothetical protein
MRFAAIAGGKGRRDTAPVSARLQRSPVACLLAACALACAGVDSQKPGDGGRADRATTNPDGGTTPPFDGPLALDLPPGAEISPRVGEVYAHSELVLYRFDPIARDFVTIGEFGCLKGGDGVALMLDIAIDRGGNMVGTAAMSEHTVITGRLVSIDKATAACQVLRTGSYPNSLAFVPVGTVLPDREALVGYDTDRYVMINPDTGGVTGIGNLNAPGAASPWQSSGDIVSIVNGGTFVTVIPKGALGPDAGGDRIVEVDPATGAVVRVIGATGTPALYGLGYWGGIAYGFSSGSQLIQIDLMSGAGTTIPIAGAPAAGFYGAGTTTIAPIVVD